MASKVRRIGAAGLALGLCFGAASIIPAHADSAGPVGGLLGGVDGGLLSGVVGSILHGEGGVFGHEGGVLAGDDQLGDVVDGFADSGDDGLVGDGLDIVGAVGDVVADPNVGGEGSLGDPVVGGGALGGLLGGNVLGGLLGGLLGGGTGLLGGVF